ncbi:hypothetical protein AXK58_21285 [Tsukamurella tyrosinosolvens]|nr:hypothetical protein AXK58_21285 [Tsukamurella tyrosinosolvens]
MIGRTPAALGLGVADVDSVDARGGMDVGVDAVAIFVTGGWARQVSGSDLAMADMSAGSISEPELSLLPKRSATDPTTFATTSTGRAADPITEMSTMATDTVMAVSTRVTPSVIFSARLWPTTRRIRSPAGVNTDCIALRARFPAVLRSSFGDTMPSS